MSNCKIGLAECKYPNTCFKPCDTCVRMKFEDEMMAIKKEACLQAIADERERIVRELEKLDIALVEYCPSGYDEYICKDDVLRIVRGGE